MTLSDLFTSALLALFLLQALVGAKRWRVWSSALLGPAVATEVARLAVGHARWQLLPAYVVGIVAVHTANPVDQRELMVRVWYPADVNGCGR